ncbi:MAG TPA: PP2C family protein-serine/threonine phosphatase [Acidimicrobiales bacterium]|nr:PP2C family protein-serine/threonine phosphatase [Acidimicrobiales bacterium]
MAESSAMAADLADISGGSPATRSSALGPFHAVSALALVIMLLLTAGATLFSRSLIRDQEHRLLVERTNEVSQVLSVSIATLTDDLATLARVNAATGTGAFTEAAKATASTSPGSYALLGRSGAGYTVLAAAGQGTRVGDTLPPAVLPTIAHADGLGTLVATPVMGTGAQRSLAFAYGLSPGQVVYHVVQLGPVGPPRAASTAPFNELRVVLYAVPRADPTQVLVTTASKLPLSGSVRYEPFKAGATAWLLGVTADRPLIGSLAADAPWTALVIGLIGTALVFMLVEAVARRRDAALALYAGEHRFAEALQRRLLPTLPELADLELATRYVPASDVHRVGGDWYDIFVLGAGRIAVVIGDVMGHDVEAATAMSQLRSALRAYAIDTDDPGTVIERLGRMIETFEMAPLVTLIYGLLEPAGADGSRLFRWSNAGHPPPMLRLPDGTVRELTEATSPLLGAPGTDRRPRQERLLPAGSCLLLYTDGLVEVPGVTMTDSIAQLRGVVEGTAGQGSAEATCAAVLATQVAENRRDDVAIIAVRLTEPVDKDSSEREVLASAATRAPAQVSGRADVGR